MNKKIFSDEEIVELLNKFIEENKKQTVTLESFAKRNYASSSTLHRGFKYRMKNINYKLWANYLIIAGKNKDVGRINGGRNHKIKKKGE